MSTMIAYRYAPATTVVIKEEIPVPSPGPDEVLLKVVAAGLCHSDLHVLSGKFPYPAKTVHNGT